MPILQDKCPHTTVKKVMKNVLMGRGFTESAWKKPKQVPPLRCAPVGMTILREALSLTAVARDGRTAGPSTALRSGRDDKS